MNGTGPPGSFRAPAKLNLALEILGKRADGFHELLSVMQTVTIEDTLTIQPAAAMAFTCSDPTLARGNLVERAMEALRAEVASYTPVRLHLDKVIPVGAGLGGGSSDAATTLLALDHLWGANLDCHRLTTLAAGLGSDVPFFLHGGTCLVAGRGERVRPLPRPAPAWYVLVTPPIHVSTARVFAAVTPEDWSDGEQTRRIAAYSAPGAPIPSGPNGLEEALCRIYPAAGEALQRIRERLPVSRLSGSGPTAFAPFPGQAEALAAAESLRDLGYWTRVAAANAPPAEGSPCVATTA